LEQQDLNKRLLLALVLSLVVFGVYGYLMPTPTPPSTAGNVTTEQRIATEKMAPTPTTQRTTTIENPTVQQNLAPMQQHNEEVITTIQAKNFHITIDKLGRFSQVTLLEEKYRTEEGHHLQMLGVDKVKPLETRFSNSKINEEAFKTDYQSDVERVSLNGGAKQVVLTQTLSMLTVTKTITFQPNGAYSVEVTTSKPAQFFVTPGYRPVADTSMYILVRGALIKKSDNVIETIEDGDVDSNMNFGSVKFASAFDRYVASVFYDFQTPMQVSVLKVNDDDPLMFVQGENNLKINAYIGPKDHEKLKGIHPELTEIIEFGWFTFLATPFYKVLLWINNYIGNWGWSIVIFTLLVKLVLFWPSYKGMISMQRLKELAPKMKELKEKYKDDSAKMSMKMMELYKKHNANPMGGCLPFLLQIPIFFALYRVLLNAEELQGAPWMLWIQDLALKDPYYVLPILMGVSMWVQQKITPQNFTDPMQEQIFKWLPVMMAFIFIVFPFPAGLVLYWVVNNIFTIAQQYYINSVYEKQKLNKEELK
jgi:YidC/Oxa1 family membrane protein insertase